MFQLWLFYACINWDLLVLSVSARVKLTKMQKLRIRAMKFRYPDGRPRAQYFTLHGTGRFDHQSSPVLQHCRPSISIPGSSSGVINVDSDSDGDPFGVLQMRSESLRPHLHSDPQPNVQHSDPQPNLHSESLEPNVNVQHSNMQPDLQSDPWLACLASPASTVLDDRSDDEFGGGASASRGGASGSGDRASASLGGASGSGGSASLARPSPAEPLQGRVHGRACLGSVGSASLGDVSKYGSDSSGSSGSASSGLAFTTSSVSPEDIRHACANPTNHRFSKEELLAMLEEPDYLQPFWTTEMVTRWYMKNWRFVGRCSDDGW